jgi:uncharacterized membrane protein
MSDLIAVAYPDVPTAVRVRDVLVRMQQENLISLADIAVVEKRADGKIKLHQTQNTIAKGAVFGSLWGGLIGMLFLAPLLGAAIGGAAGAASGSMVDLGVSDDFMKQLGEKLHPGGAALFVLVIRSTPDKVIPRIAGYGGEILHTSLSAEAEAHLSEALGAQPSAQSTTGTTAPPQ